MSELNFDHVNLSEVDPNASSVPDGPYTFQVAGVYPKNYIAKSGENAGKQGNYVSVRFAIVGTDKYAGRSTFESFFPNKGSAIMLRKVMDATGVQQAPGQAIEDWLKELQTSGATFNSFLVTKQEQDKRTTPPTPRNVQHVNLWQVEPTNS